MLKQPDEVGQPGTAGGYDRSSRQLAGAAVLGVVAASLLLRLPSADAFALTAACLCAMAALLRDSGQPRRPRHPAPPAPSYRRVRAPAPRVSVEDCRTRTGA